MGGPCPDDNELFELAEDLLPPERHGVVMAHVDACDRCRAALAAVLRERTLTDAAAPTTGDRDERLPAGLLHAYLQNDAPARERSIARFVAITMAVLLPLVLTAGRLLSVRFSFGGGTLLAAVLVYECAILRLLDRGWYRSWLPFASSLIEVSLVIGVELVAARTTLGTTALAAPGMTLLGSLVVFSALRTDRRVPLVVGAVAAVEVVVLGLLAPPAVAAGDEAGLGPHLVRAAFCVIGGLAGLTVASYLTSRAEAALREVRAQDLFGKYLLHEVLGRGGMGEVHRATYCPEGGFVRRVAVKRLRAELSTDPEFVDAFRREVELGASLVHPNLVQMLDCGRFRGDFVVAMEFVDGMSLARLLTSADGGLPLSAVTYLGSEVAAALSYVHDKRDEAGEPLLLVHCDVNPPNLMVSRIGEVKLTDFGVARATARGKVSGFGGKPRYAAPEQIREEAIDRRTDLFALGLTLYEALTGQRTIPRGETAPTVSFEPPSKKRGDIPTELDALVLELLAAAPHDRPADAATVASKLLALGGDAAPYPNGRRALAASVARASRPREPS